MSTNSNTPYGESEKIHVLIELLDEIEKLNIKNPCILSSNSRSANLVMVQPLLYDAINMVAEKTDSTSHHTERILNDIITDGDMRLNIVYFCYDIIDWLITSDKTKLKKVLMNNTTDEYHDGDLLAIDNWYKGE